MSLAKLYPHKYDKAITFEEQGHRYQIGNDSNYTSVTTWLASHFPHFDPDTVIQKMTSSANWHKSKYFPMTPNEIKTLWRENGQCASQAGTLLHAHIEDFYNGRKVDDRSPEYGYFLKFAAYYADQLQPYRTEWMIYDRELRLAGSIDMVFQDKDNNLIIYDWKRSKKIVTSNRWESATTACINYIPNSNFWKYALQLNTYAEIIERNYDKIVSELVILCLHPNNTSYQRYKVPRLRKEMQALFNLRLADNAKET